MQWTQKKSEGFANWKAHAARHLIMRFALGLVLGWFGVQQVRAPANWVDFVPSLVSQYSPVTNTGLVLSHGFLLLVASSGIILGVAFTSASLLAAALLCEIIASLFLDGGPAHLIVRNVGLLGLAIALALDPVNFWRLELAQWHRLAPDRPHTSPNPQTPPLGWKALWRIRVVGVACIVAVMLALTFLLRSF
jgi:hypothetical protein